MTFKTHNMTKQERDAQLLTILCKVYESGIWEEDFNENEVFEKINALFHEDYWKQRCELAEDALGESMHDVGINCLLDYQRFKDSNKEP